MNKYEEQLIETALRYLVIILGENYIFSSRWDESDTINEAPPEI